MTAEIIGYTNILVKKNASKLQKWSEIYTTIVGILSISILFFDIANYLSVISGISTVVTYSTLIMIIAPIIFLESNRVYRILGMPFIQWALVLSLLYVLHWIVAIALSTELVSSTIAIDLSVLLVAAAMAGGIAFMDERPRRGLMIVIAFLLPVLVAVDFFRPGVLYPIATEGAVLGRGAATFINANRAGEAVLLATILAVPLLPKRWRIVLLAVSAVGVVLTFSRAAMLGWAVVLVLLVFARFVPRRALLLPIVGATFLAAMSAVLISYVSGRADLEAGMTNLIDRVNFFQSGSLGDSSSLERLYVLEAGLQMFADNPVLGAGAGTTRHWHLRASTHNQLVLLAAELGLPGLMAFAGLLWIVYRGCYFQERRLQFASVLVILYFSLFSHNLFNSMHWLVMFSLVSQRRVHGDSE